MMVQLILVFLPHHHHLLILLLHDFLRTQQFFLVLNSHQRNAIFHFLYLGSLLRYRSFVLVNCADGIGAEAGEDAEEEAADGEDTHSFLHKLLESWII